MPPRQPRQTKTKQPSPTPTAASAGSVDSGEAERLERELRGTQKKLLEAKLDKKISILLKTFKGESEKLIKKNEHMVKTHKAEMTKAYTHMLKQVDAAEKLIEEAEEELLALVGEKEKIFNDLVDDTEKQFEALNVTAEGSTAHMQEIVLDAARFPSVISNGLLCPDLYGGIKVAIGGIPGYVEEQMKVRLRGGGGEGDVEME